MLDLTFILRDLRAVSDNDLVMEIKKLDFDISKEKLSLAFSAYGLTNFLSGTEVEALRRNLIGIPDQTINDIRWRGIFIFRAYTAFLYMRSNHLEVGLNNLTDDSPILAFRDFFRKGRTGDKTIAQHIRNSLAHGTFDLSSDLQRIEFKDSDWSGVLGASDFMDGLCQEVFRFYSAAVQSK